MRAIVILLCCCLAVLATVQSEELPIVDTPTPPSQSQISVSVEHSFDGLNFTPRGTLSFTNKKAAVTSSTKQLSKTVKWSSAGQLSSSDLELLKKSAVVGGRYYMRIPSVATTSVDACLVLAANFVDEIDVLVDFITAMPLQIDYRPAATYCVASAPVTSKDWKTSATIHFGAEGPKPQKVVESAAGATDQQKESSPWYMSWYIWAIPIVIILMAVCSAILPDEADVKKQL